jgi:hypothetical protein
MLASPNFLRADIPRLPIAADLQQARTEQAVDASGRDDQSHLPRYVVGEGVNHSLAHNAGVVMDRFDKRL